MGFAIEDIHRALRETNNSYEQAAAWLLGDQDMSDNVLCPL
jgi:uncharacterized UBP type Zn finger protein